MQDILATSDEAKHFMGKHTGNRVRTQVLKEASRKMAASGLLHHEVW